jgi:hypothetical protein
MNLEKDTLLLPHCWICEVRFRNSVPPGTASRENHHIFPRNAGGNDGPEVSLCADHHATIHKIALKIQAKKDFKPFLLGETQIRAKRLLWLASMIVKAEKFAEDDPNKLLRNGVQLNSQETAMMKRIQSVYPDKSRSDLFRYGLYLLYRKHFST